MWRGNTYEFTCLLFGLTSTPRVFTKLLKPVMTFLRGQGLRAITYLDGLLIMNQLLEVLQSQVNHTVSLLESLGFTINSEKSQLVPTWQIRFLDFIVDLVAMKLSLPEDKLQQLVQMSQSLLSQQTVSLRTRFSTTGATTLAVLPTPLWYCNLQ